MNIRIHLLALVLALLAASGHEALAQLQSPPTEIDYQGTVYDSAGKPYGSTTAGSPPVTSATPTNYIMEFRIYDALSGGNVVWAQSQLVTVSLGKFSVRLGAAGTPIGSLPMSDLKDVFSKQPRYLGVTIQNGAPPFGEISPRLAFLTVPYAFTAQQAVTATTAATALLATAVTQGSGTSTFDTVNLKTGTATTLLKAPSIEATVAVKAPTFQGSGKDLTELNAAQITTGTLPDARLGGNIPRLNGSNTFTGINTFNGQNFFSGDGTGLTVNASKITTGTLDNARLTSDVIRGSLDDKTLFIRSTNDFHGLVFGNSNANLTFNYAGIPSSTKKVSEWFGVDGPVLFGYSGGALGMAFREGGTNILTSQKILTWSRDDVLLNANLKINKGGLAATWTLSQTPNFNGAGRGEELRLGCSTTSNLWFYFQANGQFNWSSDARLKKDVTSLPPILDSVLKLRPVSFRLNERPETEHKVVGFIAQEVKPYFPDSVGFDGEHYSLSYSDFGVYAIRGLQELTSETRGKSDAAEAEIKQLREENTALRQDLSALERRLNALEAAPK